MAATQSNSLDMKLEVVVIGVTDVDRAIGYYKKLGWRLDADFASGAFRVVQVTPHNSPCSVIFGKGITAPAPGSAKSLVLAVDDVVAARDALIAGGVKVSEVFHFAGGPFNDATANARIPGPDAERRSYYSFAAFEDPDGNGWLFQEIKTRLPGREWKPASAATGADVATLAKLLCETGEHHDRYEKSHAEHHWYDWYAPYLSARQNGKPAEQAAAAADRYMDEVLHVPAR
jgi:catechol 2,3-dioxygenase-like lactoylglutathione lyase family enzyme